MTTIASRANELFAEKRPDMGVIPAQRAAWKQALIEAASAATTVEELREVVLAMLEGKDR